MHVGYKLFLILLSLALAASAVALVRSESPVKKGGIVTRWRPSGDVYERCTSCHTEPHPSAQNALTEIHPIEKYGCVSCHGGNAGSTDLAAHDGLYAVKKGEGTLSGVVLVEAACGRCHAREAKLAMRDGTDLAPHLSHGRALFEAKCAACHDSNASHDRAPPLAWLASATTPSSMMTALTAPPKAMPKFFSAEAASRDARKNIVAWLVSLDAPFDVRGAANVPGASADEGKVMFTAYGCVACHATGFVDFPAKNSEDFIASYIQYPKAIFAGAKMPSFRSNKREAASLAKYVAASSAPPSDDPDASLAASREFRAARAVCAEANGEELTHAACGAKIAGKLGCASCHTSPQAQLSQAPDFNAWGRIVPTLDRLRDAAMWPVAPKHPQIQIDVVDVPDVLVAMASKLDAQVTGDFDPTNAPYFGSVRGNELMADRGCLSCHSRSTKERRAIGGVDEARAKVPSLFAEGARVQPEWLVGYLGDPQSNGVRVSSHPEWVWGELVPTAKMAVRMPSYALTNEETTAIVQSLSTEDRGDFPYANVAPPSLTTNEILSAAIHVNGAADNGGDCLRCHYVGALPSERAKTSLDGIAPDLGKISRRLRPWFVADLLARPQDFVEGMPALWPDPNGAPLTWTIPHDTSPKKTAIDQITLVRDFLFLLRDETRLPRAGDELRTPIFGLASAANETRDRGLLWGTTSALSHGKP